MNRSAIFAAMKRASMLCVLLLFSAIPLFAQSSEFGVIVGGSRRFVHNGLREGGVEWLDSKFSFSNSSVELFWGMKFEEDMFLKLKVGRIETQIAQAYTLSGVPGTFRRDAEGEVTHADAIVEYRFSEAYGSTGIFGGVGMYRQSGEGLESRNNFGWQIGSTSDFPLSRNYGIMLEAAYHVTNGDFRPRYLTVGGGLRISF
jgi:hypothetical protein